ncbi:hypothetical protein Pedsa_1139 [Pseudopedobacter saltans DSM 12145]|uniref:Lipoprotein n=2 Tax=Pseudopedobacter saltans TaxID=151895 RepID=F0SCB1_PSESL|nr:hypothetical protein Pedsa_1139 [Pseudopedobacter saltans DSM 12145]
MKRQSACLMILILVYTVCSCNSPSKTNTNKNEDTTATIKAESTDSVHLAQIWLKRSIEGFFKDFDQLKGNFSSITTPGYYEFKMDAIHIDYDGGLSETEFKNKWSQRYSEFAGVNEGFMIGGNDFGTVKVKECKFINRTKQHGYLFHTIIEDTELHNEFIRDITVVSHQGSFLIDDVKEIEDIFPND